MPPVSFFLYKLEHFFLYKLTTQIIMNYLRGRLIIAKYIIFNRGIWLSFETYRQHFYRF